MPLSDALPVIDDRRYDDILAEARTRIPRYTPEWTDLNDSDPGMTLVQLFAWMTDMLLYRLGRVPELNYIKFLELIGIELMPAEPATAEITFPVMSTVTDPYIIVPMHTQVSAQDPDAPGPIIFETDEALTAIAAQLDSVQSFDGYAYDDVSQTNTNATDGYLPFGLKAARDSAVLLGFNYAQPFPQIELNLAVVVTDDGAAQGVSCNVLQTVAYPSATIAWEYWDGSAWRSLSLLKDDSLALTRSGHIYIQTPAPGLMQTAVIGDIADARYWIRGRITSSAYERVPSVLAIRTNTVSATQAETVQDEVLGGSDGSPNQVFQLANTPVLDGTLQLEVDEGDGFVVWTEVEDFFGSGAQDQNYILDRTTGQVQFGDGTHGAIPVGNNASPTSNIVARTYRFGGGANGNVPAGALDTLVTSIQGIDDNGVQNLVAAVGGQDEESLDDAKLRAPLAIRSRNRAVTADDFEQLAIQSADIKRAKALPLAHPDFPGVQVPGVVTVIVVPDSPAPNPTPSEGTLRSVCAYLNQARLLTTELYVVPPTYQQVSVSAQVTVEDTADLAQVKQAIETALLTYFHPLTGGEDGTGWPFGGSIYYSRVYGQMSVTGVQSIDQLVISVDGKAAPACTNIPICPGVLLYSTDHEITVNYDTGS